jgi:hypothetical protein
MSAKSSVLYPAVIAAAVLGMVGLVLGWLHFEVTIEPITSDTTSIPKKAVLPQQTGLNEPVAVSSVEPISKPKSIAAKQDLAQSSSQSPAIPGSLRISNQTEQPVRVALLARSGENSTAANKSDYSEPVHWDFAPGEGSSQGLVLSLPEGNLKLSKGDILVVFAQDGSRRYWGPYVVGETDAPTWNQKTSEWQLTLKP